MVETIVCWYLHGTRIIFQGFFGGADCGFRNHPQHVPWDSLKRKETSVTLWSFMRLWRERNSKQGEASGRIQVGDLPMLNMSLPFT